jgi:hypothetical protein
MKTLSLVLLLFSLTACDGSTAKGFWGPSAPAAAIWGQEQTPLCKFYGNCDGDGSDNGAASNGTDDNNNGAGGATAGSNNPGSTNDASSWWWGNTGDADKAASGNTDSGGTKSCELYGNCE